MFHCRSSWRTLTIQQYGNGECPEPSQMIITMKGNTEYGPIHLDERNHRKCLYLESDKKQQPLDREPQKKQRIFLAKQCSSNEKSICAKPQIEHCLWINSLGSHLLLPLFLPAPITPQTTRLDFVLFYLWLISVLSYYRMEEFNKIATSLAFYSAGNATIPDRMNGGMPADSYRMDGCLPF